MTTAIRTKKTKHANITISDGEIGMTLGNMKLPYSTAIWSLPALLTCPGAKDQGCGFFKPDGTRGGWCYAMKSERLYPQVLPFLKRNLSASMEDDYEERMWRLLMQVVHFRRIKVDAIRLHVNGDFYNQRYLDVWVRLAARLKRERRKLGRTIKVYAYTKSVDLDFSARSDNFIVLLSDDKGIWQDQYHRFDGVFAIDNPQATLQCIEDCTQCNACMSRKHFHIGVRKH